MIARLTVFWWWCCVVFWPGAEAGFRLRHSVKRRASTTTCDSVHGTLQIFSGTTRALCKCDKHWVSPFCSQPKCFNEGRLLPSRDKCDCPEFYAGTHCLIPLCKKVGGFLKGNDCECYAGFYGKFCQHVCVHGKWEEEKCVCDPGYWSLTCERCEFGVGVSCFLLPVRDLVIWGILILAAAIAFLAFAVYFCRKRRRSRSSNSGLPYPYANLSPSSPPPYNSLEQSAPLIPNLGPPPSYMETVVRCGKAWA